MNTMKTVVIPLCLSIAITSCGGGKSGTPAPIAAINLSASQFDIGNDRDIILGSTDSIAKNGQLTAYLWSVASAPAFSHAQPIDVDASETTFTPDVPGNYSLCLTVTDEKKVSAPDCDTLTVTNSVPIALLSDEAIILVGQQYQLDASRSLPPTDGNVLLLDYQWQIESSPEDSTATLDDDVHKTPRFTPDVEGDYVLSLTVSYDGITSTKASTRIIANRTNALPIANAGGNITTWVLGEKISLDGSASYDPDGDALQFRWGFGSSPTLIGGLPDGSQAILADTNTATPSFVPDMIGSYSVWMQVFDGTSVSGAVVSIKVDQLPAGHINTKPVAFISAPWGKTFEAELGSKVSFTATYSYDKETPSYQVHNIGKRWRLLRYPAGFDVVENVKTQEFGTPEAPSFSITFAKEGDYDVQLEVFDGELWSDPVVQTFTALTGANRPPTAKPSITGVGAVNVGQLVTLDGEGSTDPDGNRLSYAWALLHKPDGSHAALSRSTSAFPTFTTDVAGNYLVELIVTDSHGFSSAAARLQVFAKARNNAPVARPWIRYKHYNAEQPLAIYPSAPVDLDTWQNGQEPWHNSVHFVSDAYDPDGDGLSYLWSLLDVTDNHQFAWATNGNASGVMSGTCDNGYRVDAQGPYTTHAEFYNAVIALRDWTCQDLNLAPVNPGTYRVQLLVSDGIDAAGPYEFNIPAVYRADYPTLLLEKTQVGNTNAQGGIGDIKNHSKQQILPHVYGQQSSFPVFDSNFAPLQNYVNAVYTLTAFDRDYTITNLQAVADGISAEYGYSISFDGLNDGDVITKGQTREFSLIIHVPEDLRGYEGTSAWLINLGSGLKWSFSIQEKPEWTFSHIPYIFPSRTNSAP